MKIHEFKIFLSLRFYVFAIFAILRALNFVVLVKFSLPKVQNFVIIENSESLLNVTDILSPDQIEVKSSGLKIKLVSKFHWFSIRQTQVEHLFSYLPLPSFPMYQFDELNLPKITTSRALFDFILHSCLVFTNTEMIEQLLLPKIHVFWLFCFEETFVGTEHI